jgi:hypothetical protein
MDAIGRFYQKTSYLENNLFNINCVIDEERILELKCHGAGAEAKCTQIHRDNPNLDMKRTTSFQSMMLMATTKVSPKGSDLSELEIKGSSDSTKDPVPEVVLPLKARQESQIQRTNITSLIAPGPLIPWHAWGSANYTTAHASISHSSQFQLFPHCTSSLYNPRGTIRGGIEIIA